MNNPDKYFKDKLYDLETPLGGEVSFEKVMAMRGQKRGPVWWKPALLVVSTLSVVSLAGYFAFDSNKNVMPDTAGSAVISDSRGSSVHGSGKQATNNDQTETISEQDKSASNSTPLVNQSRSLVPIGDGISPETDPIVPVQIAEPIESTVNTGFSMIDASGLRFFGVRAYYSDFSLASLKKARTRESEVIKPKTNLPMLELMMSSGGGRVNDFDANSPYSIRGVHRMAQYSAMGLWDLGKGFQLGGGFSFGQFAGFGEYRSVNEYFRQQIDTNTIIIVQPGLPDKTVTTYDTTNVLVSDVKTGEVKYNLSKVSLPIGLRYYIGEGTTLLRLSATLSPGLLTSSGGNVFDRSSYMEVNRSKNTMTFDARLGAGLYYVAGKRVNVVIEPVVSYQSVLGTAWSPYRRISPGMSFGLVIKL